MPRKYMLSDLVTTQIGEIKPGFSDKFENPRQENLEEHIALIEDLIIDLRAALVKRPVEKASVIKSNATIKKALQDYKGIIEEALDAIEEEGAGE